jgi:hypothetical protein
MKKNIIFYLFIILFVVNLPATIYAQSVENFSYKIVNGKVNITYDLITAKETQEVEVRLFCTMKGFDMRLYRATGDIGKELKAGRGKKIEWNNNEELTSYNKEDMTFKLQVLAKKQPVKEVEKVKNKGIFAGLTGGN